VPSELIADTIAAMVRGEDPPRDAKSSHPELDPSSGEPLTSICPECGGVLTERSEAGVVLWECGVGHRYSPERLADVQADRA